MNGRMDEWTNGRMDEWMNELGKWWRSAGMAFDEMNPLQLTSGGKEVWFTASALSAGGNVL